LQEEFIQSAVLSSFGRHDCKSTPSGKYIALNKPYLARWLNFDPNSCPTAGNRELFSDFGMMELILEKGPASRLLRKRILRGNKLVSHLPGRYSHAR